MKKVLLAISVLMFVLPSARALAQAQAQPYRTEVCVNASDEAAAKRLFPAATIHVIPNDTNPRMNGWRVTYTSRAENMSDAEEIQLRWRELNRTFGD